MTRHLTRRACGKGAGFSWSRFTHDGEFVTYRLFRRDYRGALHTQMLTLTGQDSRAYIAERLNRARHQLREKVDDIDLAAIFQQENAA